MLNATFKKYGLKAPSYALLAIEGRTSQGRSVNSLKNCDEFLITKCN